MAGDKQVFALLEEMLNSGRTPEDVCLDFPELLPEVQERWRNFQLIDERLQAVLPTLGAPRADHTPAAPEATPEPPAAFGRYEVRGTLGKGGFGVVYLGHDTQLDRPVAIKSLRAGCLRGDAANERALEEAKRLAQLRHSGIVAVHDVGVHEDQFFIVSDFIEGADLRQKMKNERMHWTDAAAIVGAVADALAYAHSRLIVHRDVKPANILLTSTGTPVLVDFGLALDDSHMGGDALGVVAGTPWYMSPEQAAGAAHRIDGRTDVYSLGVVLYEMLTGQLPFRATRITELLRQVREDEPQPPRQLVGEIPPELERVCLRALAKRQQDRFTTAADFAAEVRRILPTKAPAERTVAPRAGAAHTSTLTGHHRTVGRQDELEELHRAFESAAAGRARFQCVTGEPGLGKTTLVEAFIGELVASGRPVFVARGRCSERLAGAEAYLPFLEALESLLHGEQSDSVAQVMKSVAPNWYDQVAPLAAQDSSLTRILAEAKAASQERLKREMAAFLRELSQLRPLLLFIDDLHWADASTVDLLTYLGGKCEGMCALAVFTYRPTDLALARHPFGPVKLDLQARGICRELALNFLSRDNLDRYLDIEFPQHSFPNEFKAVIHQRTEGSPLFMTDLLRYLRDQRILMQAEGRWSLQQSVPDLQQALPESVRSMIQRKIEQLSDDDRRLLVAASVQGYEFDSAVVAQVLDRDAADVEDRLNELDRVHVFVRMVREQEFPDHTLSVRYRFVHALYQNALYASLQPTRRASLSAMVAQALVDFYGDRSAEVAAELALLLQAARDFQRAADYFLKAAQGAVRVFANQEAVVLARRGIEMLSSLPNSPERSRKELDLQITLGPALFATKDWTDPDVEAVYKRAHILCGELGESPDLFPALWGLFLFHTARGEIHIGLNRGKQLLDLAERGKDSAQFLQAHHALGGAYLFTGDWARARTHLEQAVAYYDPQQHSTHAFLYGGHDPRLCCLSFAAKALWMLGFPEQALERGHEALALAREFGHPTSLVHTQLSIAVLHQFRGDVAATHQLAETLEAIAADQGIVYYQAGGAVLRGWALVQQGHTDEGLALIREGFKVGGATRAHWRAYSFALLAEAHGKEENYADALVALTEGITVVKNTGVCIYEPEMYRLKGEFLLKLKPVSEAEAEACFCEAVAIARRHQAKSLELRATLDLARLWQGQNRHAEAHSALAPVYGGFTEGFETSDLLSAERLLNDLS